MDSGRLPINDRCLIDPEDEWYSLEQLFGAA